MPVLFLYIAVVCLVAIPTARAQQVRPPAVTSPEIDASGTVTFRIYAPNAKEVAVTGDWMRPADKPVALVRGSDGVWTGSTTGIEPGPYWYSFNVDGLRMGDPSNTETVVGGGGRFPQSAIRIGGDGRAIWESQPLPKGTVHIEFFESAMQQRERSYYVYHLQRIAQQAGTASHCSSC